MSGLRAPVSARSLRAIAFGAASALALLVAGSGCRKEPAPAPDAGPPEVAAPQIPDALRLTVIVESPELGSVLVAFDEEDRPDVPQAQSLRVRTNLLLTNYRIRLLDEADRVVPSDDLVRTEPDGLLYEIGLVEPLKTGFAYALVIDPQTGAEVRDAHGRSHPEQRLEFRVAGEREKPQPEQRPSRSNRRRR